jgi:hypothetical protein
VSTEFAQKTQLAQNRLVAQRALRGNLESQSLQLRADDGLSGNYPPRRVMSEWPTNNPERHMAPLR